MVSIQDLIGSVANNVAVFVLSFASELEQQAGDQRQQESNSIS